MRTIGLFIIILGIIYLIYSILFRNQVTIYNKDNKMVIHDMNGYLRLQLYFSIIESLYFVITGVLTTIIIPAVISLAATAAIKQMLKETKGD